MYWTVNDKEISVRIQVGPLPRDRERERERERDVCALGSVIRLPPKLLQWSPIAFFLDEVHQVKKMPKFDVFTSMLRFNLSNISMVSACKQAIPIERLPYVGKDRANIFKLRVIRYTLNMSRIIKESSYEFGNGHFSDIELEETFSSKSSCSESNSFSSIVNTLTGSKQQLNEDMELILGSENTGDKRRIIGAKSKLTQVWATGLVYCASAKGGCKLAFCKTIADECQPFLQRFQTSKPMTPYLFEAVEKLLRYLMNRCVKPDLMKCTGPKLLSIDTKKSENLILSKNIDIGFATKRLLGETAITVTERQKLEFIHECRSMLTTMIAKLQEKSPLKQKAVRGLSSLDPCVIQHSPQLAQKRFSFLLEELNHANIINDVLAENAKKEYLHFCNLKKSELQEIFRPCDQFSDEVGLDTIYGSFLIGEANYKHLWEVIKICLVLSHGNATVEGGFSVNKSLLVENMHEKTVIAQRHIHDEIQEAGGIKNIHISKKMLDYVRGARKRYHEYLEMKKQEKSEKDKKKAEKRKLDIQVKDLEGERKKLMMATEEKREAIDVELQELKKKQASLY
uniref:Uncharacterized protein n=1 Tax=Timema monikensis TaxID=170555 RepID=A0A7R9HSV4_9NEOP|nr:unnamed protein product [Timema monikensis]